MDQTGVDQVNRAALEYFALWLIETKRGKLVVWFLERGALALGALITLWCLYQIETRFMPVITKWDINPVIRQGDRYILGGTMTKDRACELVSTSVMAVPNIPLAPRVLIYQIKPNEIDGGNIPTGSTTWGPWTMNIPKAFLDNRDKIAWIEIVGSHRCHALWTQETLYGRVEMGQLP
jgi:hypothetical protein